MQHYALIENDKVVNVVWWDGDSSSWSPPESSLVIASEIAQIGDSYNADTGEFTSPVVEIPVPLSITRPQAAKQLLAMELITPAEAVAMVANATPPGMVSTLISALSPEDQITALIDFARYTYDRDYPLLNNLMTAAGKTSTDIDNFFIAAASL